MFLVLRDNTIMQKIILFGASDDTKKFLETNRLQILFGELRVIAIADNDSRLRNTKIHGIPVISSEEIPALDYDHIIITPIFFDEILSQLRSIGVPIEKVSPLYVNYRDHFDKVKREFGTCEIGRYSYFKPGTNISNAIIGSFCHIGTNCIIGQGGHNPENVTSYPLNYHFSKKINDCSKDKTADLKRISKKAIIGNDVYIGEGVVVFSGVKIGNGAIVASKALITKDVPDYAIVGGIPAKVLRMRFPDDQIETLKNIKWWNWSDQKILEKIDLLESNIDTFLKEL